MSRTGRILVVDDTRAMRLKLAGAATSLGHQCHAVGSGSEALDHMRGHPVDAVLLDIVMPEMDGFDVLKAMKSDPALRDIPVIVISSLDDTESAVTAIELGAEDFLPKNFDPVIFRARVNTLLQKKYVRDAEVDYLNQVEKLARAAQILKVGNYNPSKLGLGEISERDDALGDLARVFADAAQKVYERERRLRQSIKTLRGGFGLIVLGLIWGLVAPLSRMASGLEAHPFGMAFWVSLLSGLCCIGWSVAKGTVPKAREIPWGYFLAYALLGAVVSESLLFIVAGKVEASIISIIIVLEGFLAFAFAAFTRIEQPSLSRFAGLLLGLLGVLVILYDKFTGAVPGGLLWTVIALAIPACYAAEGIMLAAKRPEHIPTVTTVGLMQLTAAAILLPIALSTGEMIYPSAIPGALELTVVLIAAASLSANVLFLYLINNLGAVFTGQAAYFTTIAGIGWSMLLLGESLNAWIWAALALTAAGLFLVGPKREAELEPPPAMAMTPSMLDTAAG
ncbi:response regulator [Taklimakanibacter deserti]|uniref:response regulator n=1 Tax=Taklimakanibacter deserti TaxID=2267839 RepID=UPI000E65D9F8